MQDQDYSPGHKVVIGLQPFGTVLWNRVLRYCHETGQPTDLETQKNIYHQAVVQCFDKLSPDLRDCTYQLMEIPHWHTMNYTEANVAEPAFRTFADEVRAFGLSLWHHMAQRGFLKAGRHYYVESSTEMLAIVGFFDDAAYV